LDRNDRALNLSLEKRQNQLESGSNKKDINDIFKLSIGFDSSLANLQESDSGRTALRFSLSIKPRKYMYFTLTSIWDINGYKNPYYQPDYYYTFGYSDYHKDTWGFSYSNYKNNILSKDNLYGFKDGSWEIHYKTKIKDIDLIAKATFVPSEKEKFLSLNGYTTLNDYTSLSIGYEHYFHIKQEKLTISAKSFLYDKLFVSATAFLYSNLDNQTELESDYSYSFGWQDNRPYHFSIKYAQEYSPTRWPWRDTKYPSFSSGKISISMNF